MKDLTWRVTSVEGGWAELRRAGFLFVVPVEQLPAGVATGEVLDTQGGSQQTGYPAFRRQSSPKPREATA